MTLLLTRRAVRRERLRTPAPGSSGSGCCSMQRGHRAAQRAGDIEVVGSRPPGYQRLISWLLHLNGLLVSNSSGQQALGGRTDKCPHLRQLKCC